MIFRDIDGVERLYTALGYLIGGSDYLISHNRPHEQFGLLKSKGRFYAKDVLSVLTNLRKHFVVRLVMRLKFHVRQAQDALCVQTNYLSWCVVGRISKERLSRRITRVVLQMFAQVRPDGKCVLSIKTANQERGLFSEIDDQLRKSHEKIVDCKLSKLSNIMAGSEEWLRPQSFSSTRSLNV